MFSKLIGLVMLVTSVCVVSACGSNGLLTLPTSQGQNRKTETFSGVVSKLDGRCQQNWLGVSYCKKIVVRTTNQGTLDATLRTGGPVAVYFELWHDGTGIVRGSNTGGVFTLSHVVNGGQALELRIYYPDWESTPVDYTLTVTYP